MDATTTPPDKLPSTVRLGDLTGAEPLWTRHRNNPFGAWQPLASADARRNDNYFVAALLADGSWARVIYRENGGRPPGIVETTPRKKKVNKKSEPMDKITVDS